MWNWQRLTSEKMTPTAENVRKYHNNEKHNFRQDEIKQQVKPAAV